MASQEDKIQLEQNNIFLHFITIFLRFIGMAVTAVIRAISYLWLMLCETVTKLFGKQRALSLTADEAEWLAAKPFEHMPGHPRLPVFGTIWAMFRLLWVGFDVNRFNEVHKQNFKDYGYIWRFMVPGLPPIVNTARPEDSEILFRNEGRYPERPGFETLKHYRANRPEQFTSDGILIDHGEGWWRIRSKARHAFLNKKKVENYMPVLGNIAEEFIDRIRLIRLENNEMRPDFINEMYKWALESVAVVGLNNRLGCLDPNLTPDSEGQKMINAVNNSFLAMNKMEFGLPIWKYIMTPTMRQLFEAQDFFTETAIKYINKTLDDIKKRPVDSQEDPSILEELFIQGISPKDAMVMVCDMLIAGIDTTSNSTSFLLYFLAKNPEKQEKLREEILTIVGPKGSRITASALEQLHYLKACINESLRLMPAAIGNARYANKDLVLSGYRVHKGTLVITAHQLLAQLEEFFPNAKEYIPERWIKGHPLESQHSPYALLPFGFGKRMCVGRRLAELEMEQLTIKILQNFKIEYHYQDISCFTRTVNVPDQPLSLAFIDL